jgi:uncharacterized protein (DUF302 family)
VQNLLNSIEKPFKVLRKMKQYYFSKITDYSFDDAIQTITETLKDEGFGILMDIDVKATLKQKIDYDFKRYTILGACHPQLAKEALGIEDKIGIMMPCNVVVIEQPEGGVEVCVVNPMMFAEVVKNDRLECFATEVRGKIRRALSRI